MKYNTIQLFHVIGVIQRHMNELESVRNNHRSGLKSGRERLQEMNRKLSKLTSKKKVILAFEAYSYFCIPVYRAIKGLTSYVDNCLSGNLKYHLSWRQLLIVQSKASRLM